MLIPFLTPFIDPGRSSLPICHSLLALKAIHSLHPTHSLLRSTRSLFYTTMDVRTPALILLCSLVAALAFAVLGLAADNVSYAHKHGDDTLDIHYLRWNQTAEATYSYWVQIDYLPSSYSLTRINAMLGASVVTALAGIAIALISWLVRGDRSPQVGFSFKVR